MKPSLNVQPCSVNLGKSVTVEDLVDNKASWHKFCYKNLTKINLKGQKGRGLEMNYKVLN